MLHQYRMVTNGKKYKVQKRKNFFWWIDVSFTYKNNPTINIVEFDDELVVRGAMISLDKNKEWKPIPKYNQ